MNTKHSEAKAASPRSHDGGAENCDSAASFVMQLGDVKVETKTPSGTDVIDSVMPLETFSP